MRNVRESNTKNDSLSVRMIKANFFAIGIIITTVNPLLAPPRGAYLFQAHLRGGLIETGGLFERRGLFDLETTMVSVLHKELECKVEKLRYKTFQVMQPRIRIKSDLPIGK